MVTNLIKPGFYSQNFDKLVTRITRTVQKMDWRNLRPELAERLAAWAMKKVSQKNDLLPTDSQDFLAWLGNLSKAEKRGLGKQVESFCHSQNFELTWVVDAQLKGNTPFLQSLADIVLLYCLAQWRASQRQADVKAFWAWQSWLEKLKSKAYKNLNQTLYTQLVDKGIAFSPPSSLLMAADEIRYEYVIQAIRRALDKHCPEVWAIFKQLPQR